MRAGPNQCFRVAEESRLLLRITRSRPRPRDAQNTLPTPRTVTEEVRQRRDRPLVRNQLLARLAALLREGQQRLRRRVALGGGPCGKTGGERGPQRVAPRRLQAVRLTGSEEGVVGVGKR